jgi:hypothetical protein
LPVTVVSEPGDGDDVGDEKKAPEREREKREIAAYGGGRGGHTRYSDVAVEESNDKSRIAVASTAGARDGTAVASLRMD